MANSASNVTARTLRRTLTKEHDISRITDVRLENQGVTQLFLRPKKRIPKDFLMARVRRNNQK